MLILTTKDSQIENIDLCNPECSNGVLFCDVSKNGDPLYIQTPKLFFSETSNGLRLMFDNEKKSESIDTFYGMVRDIEDSICDKLSERSEEWFPNKISSETIKNSLFRSSIKLPNRINDPLSFVIEIPRLGDNTMDVEFFDSSQNKKSYSDLFNSQVKECTFLLTIKELNITSTQASIVWELVQVLIHKKKKKVKGFGIRIEEPLPVPKIKLGIESLKTESEASEEPKVSEVSKESEAPEVPEEPKVSEVSEETKVPDGVIESEVSEVECIDDIEE